MSQTTASPRRAASWAPWAFYLGLLLGMTLLAGIAWAHFEARMFYPWDTLTPGKTHERLRSLRCPLVVGQDEVAQIRLTIANPLDRPLRRFVRVTVALGHVLLVDQQQTWLNMAPHEKRALSWEIPASEGVYGGRILMTSVYSFYTSPGGEIVAGGNDCGIWVWPIRGISGAWALALVSGLVFGLMAAGLYPGRLARVSGVTRGLFGLYLAGWVAEMGFEGWLVGGLVSALLGMILLMWALQQLEGP